MSVQETRSLPQEDLSLRGPECRLHYFPGDEGEREEYLVVSRGAYDALTKSLTEKIKQSGFQPDLVDCILRGGAIPGRHQADYLGDLPMLPVTIASAYDVDGTRLPPRILQPLPDPEMVESQLRALKKLGDNQHLNRVLVIDELIDHSDTSQLARQHIEEIWKAKLPQAEIKFAALFVKNHIEGIDWYVERTNAWVIFPWEIRETIINLARRWRGYKKVAPLEDGQITSRLQELGFSDKDIREFLPRGH